MLLRLLSVLISVFSLLLVTPALADSSPSLSTLNITLRAQPNPDLANYVVSAAGFVVADGGDSSGGGFTLRNENGDFQLLDFLLHAEDLEQIPAQNDPPQPIEGLRPHFEVLGFQFVDYRFFRDESFYELMTERLEAWKSSSPHVIKVVEDAIASINWRLTPYLLQKADPDSDLFTTVLYIQEKGAWLSVPIWNQMRDIDRAGLFIHEAFRHSKVFGDEQLAEETLFWLTAKIMLTLPENGETLDNLELYHPESSFFQILNSHVATDSLQELFEATIDLTRENVENDPDLPEDSRPIFLAWLDGFRQSDINDLSEEARVSQILNLIYQGRYNPHEATVAQDLADAVHEFRKLSNDLQLHRLAWDNSVTNIFSNFQRVELALRFSTLTNAVDHHARTGTFPLEGTEEERQELAEAIETLRQETEQNLREGRLIEPYL